MRTRTAVLGAIVATAALVVAGCGGSSDSGSSDNTTAAQATTSAGGNGGGASRTVTIAMSDYAFAPNNLTTKAGNVTISAPNGGAVPHELVLFKTDKSPTSLPRTGTEVNEEGLEASGVESPGEIEDVAPGETKAGDFNLTPGKYVMICNLPGHFQRGMYGTITVK